jgi:mono/diheme cytochrome c family protein
MWHSWARGVFLVSVLCWQPAVAAGNAQAGRDLVMRSCISCHAPNDTGRASDGAPPLSFIARENLP